MHIFEYVNINTYKISTNLSSVSKLQAPGPKVTKKCVLELETGSWYTLSEPKSSQTPKGHFIFQPLIFRVDVSCWEGTSTQIIVTSRATLPRFVTSKVGGLFSNSLRLFQHTFGTHPKKTFTNRLFSGIPFIIGDWGIADWVCSAELLVLRNVSWDQYPTLKKHKCRSIY